MTDQQELAFNKPKQSEEPEESDANLNDLPVLPFEKILSYLSPQDLLKSRAVSRRWYRMINGFRVKRLFYSKRLNLIGSSRFEPFVSTSRVFICVISP